MKINENEAEHMDIQTHRDTEPQKHRHTHILFLPMNTDILARIVHSYSPDCYFEPCKSCMHIMFEG